MRWSLVFLLFLLGRQVVQLYGQRSVGGTCEDVCAGSSLAAVEDVKDVLKDRPAVGLLEGDVFLQTLQSSLSYIDDFRFLLLEANEAKLNCVNTRQHTLANPLLHTAAVGKVLLEHKRTLGLLDVLNPPTVSRCLHEGTDEAGCGCGGLAICPYLDTIDVDRSIDVDVIHGYLQVFLKIAKLLLGLFIFLLLSLFALLIFLIFFLIFFLIIFLNGVTRC